MSNSVTPNISHGITAYVDALATRFIEDLIEIILDFCEKNRNLNNRRHNCIH